MKSFKRTDIDSELLNLMVIQVIVIDVLLQSHLSLKMTNQQIDELEKALGKVREFAKKFI